MALHLSLSSAVLLIFSYVFSSVHSITSFIHSTLAYLYFSFHYTYPLVYIDVTLYWILLLSALQTSVSSFSYPSSILLRSMKNFIVSYSVFVAYFLAFFYSTTSQKHLLSTHFFIPCPALTTIVKY